MPYFDWLEPPKDTAEYDARLESLISCDVLQLLKRDPRDEIFGTLLYWHPKPVPVRAQIAGVFELGPSLSQLIVQDMIDSGLVMRSATGNLQVTSAGLEFATARLVGPDPNSNYEVREGAPSYRPLSDVSSITLKYLILRDDPDTRFLIEYKYHPVLGRATFD